jgi:hypothetical protein
MGFLLAYWKGLAKGADRPEFADFKLTDLQTVGFDHNVHLIDVEAPNPDDFHLIRQAPATVIHRVGDNVPLKVLGEGLYPREVRADYNAAKYSGTPAFQLMSVRTLEGALRYHRLILPCAVRDGRIGRFVVGVAHA